MQCERPNRRKHAYINLKNGYKVIDSCMKKKPLDFINQIIVQSKILAKGFDMVPQYQNRTMATKLAHI